ncbi:hypothetical protein FGO68_gene9440 [Halteria grandinella]|uniref:Uncharacterized protein n=1 Tax=Halteria grandinella TaxID=5974 RepID=A0A8J8T0E7_HALGN|nr:hypothetical protein FGO68_gene9440 [Halteria grandinella]
MNIIKELTTIMGEKEGHQNRTLRSHAALLKAGILPLLILLTFVEPSYQAIQIYIPTDEDRANAALGENSTYEDPCMANNNGEICTYCCIISLGGGSCSRNIQACDRMYDREFQYISYLLAFLLSAVCGCPLFAVIMRCCILQRCCARRYENTQGVTCMELIFRIFCRCFFRFDQEYRKPGVDDYMGVGSSDWQEGEDGEGNGKQNEIKDPFDFGDAKPGSAGDEGAGMDEEKALILQNSSSAKGRNQMGPEQNGPMGMGGSSHNDMATLPPSANNRH